MFSRSMPNSSHRPTSRTPSIPIPNASGRSIEDILNLNSLGSPTSPGGASASAHRERDPTQQRASTTFHRSLYSGIEGTRPSPVASGSPGGNVAFPIVGTRHASVGTSTHTASSASSWVPPRSASVSVGYNTPAGGAHRAIAGFEPRIVRGTSTPPVSEINTTSRTLIQRRDSNASTSPTRSRLNSGGRSSLPVSRSVPSAGTQLYGTAPQYGAAASQNVVQQGSGSHAFKRPSYLQYTAMRDRIRIDTAPPPLVRAVSYVAHGLGSGRDVTPITESDDDSEGSSGFSRRRMFASRRQEDRERGRAPRNSNADAHSIAAGIDADPIINLPTRWNEQERHKHLSVSEDGRVLHFHGPPSTGEKEAAAARANYPIPPVCGIYYYEVSIECKGAQGHISVGFSCPNVRLSRLPGWEKESWGYHGDDGNSFASEREGTAFGPRFTTGDTIGCGIDFTLYKAFYTKNGVLIGYTFDGIGKGKTIFPAIGLRTAGEAVKVNFGQEPFKYDIDYHVHCARERTWAKIQATPVKWEIDVADEIVLLEADKAASTPDGIKGACSDDTVKPEPEPGSRTVKQDPDDYEYEPIENTPNYSEPINSLILSYLTHHGYDRTAKAFEAKMGSRSEVGTPPTDVSMKKAEEIDLDIKMETDDSLPGPCLEEYNGPFNLDSMEAKSSTKPETSQQTRQRIVNAVQTGNIDLALELAQESCPMILDVDDGLIHLKLRCRKFVELILLASDALQKVKGETETVEAIKPTPVIDRGKDSGAMEVDDEGPNPKPPCATNGSAKLSDVASPSVPIVAPRMSKKRSSSRSPPTPAMAAYQAALAKALEYGRRLQSDYRTDPRQVLLKTTFSLVSYEDPRTVGGAASELTSQEARNELAQEVNQVILESQGRPSRPALERLYRQAAATVTKLALMGIGEAAFADMEKEFLSD